MRLVLLCLLVSEGATFLIPRFQKGWRLGSDVFGDTYGDMEPRPPTEKQVAFAQRLASERGLQVPMEAMENSMSMSSFIESALGEGNDQQFNGGTYGDMEPRPPTEKQVAFAQRLASEKGLQIPMEAMENSMSMSSFIESALGEGNNQQSNSGTYGDMEPRPPTEKQVAFAQRLASERGLQVPMEAMENSMSMSSFIESALQQQSFSPEVSFRGENNQQASSDYSRDLDSTGGGMGYAGAPTEKQLAFAERLASEAGVAIPEESMASSPAISQFIDGMLQQQKQQRGNGGGRYAPASMGQQQDGETFLELDLGRMRNVRVRTFAGRVMVDVREFYESQDGSMLLPTKKGIALSVEQWQLLRQAVADVDAAVRAATSSVENGQLEQQPQQQGLAHGEGSKGLQQQLEFNQHLFGQSEHRPDDPESGHNDVPF